MATLEPVEGASALLMNVDPVAREVCAAAGSGQILYAASDAADSVYQEVARPSQQKRATRAIDEYSVRLDLSRRRAESRMKMGGAFLRTPPSALRMRTAPPPPRPGKSLLLASVKGNLGISAMSQQMRRLFGPRGGPAWGDVLAATDVYVESIGDDYAARAAYR